MLLTGIPSALDLGVSSFIKPLSIGLVFAAIATSLAGYLSAARHKREEIMEVSDESTICDGLNAVEYLEIRAVSVVAQSSNYLQATIFVILCLVLAASSVYLYVNWNTFHIDGKNASFLALCFVSMLLGICTQMLYVCYRDNRELSSVRPQEILFPLFYSVVIFSVVLTQIHRDGGLFGALYTSFISGFTFKTINEPRKAPYS